MLGLIAVGCNALYGTAALFLGSHWELDQHETVALSRAVDNALATLPEEYYGIIRKTVEQYIPWIALIITASAITVPRYQQSFNRQSNDSAETPSVGNVAPIFGRNGVTDTGNPGNYTNGVISSE